jgi:hypothetical protein
VRTQGWRRHGAADAGTAALDTHLRDGRRRF